MFDTSLISFYLLDCLLFSERLFLNLHSKLFHLSAYTFWVLTVHRIISSPHRVSGCRTAPWSPILSCQLLDIPFFPTFKSWQALPPSYRQDCPFSECGQSHKFYAFHFDIIKLFSFLTFILYWFYWIKNQYMLNKAYVSYWTNNLHNSYVHSIFRTYKVLWHTYYPFAFIKTLVEWTGVLVPIFLIN